MKKGKAEDIDSLFKKGLEDPVSEAGFRDEDWSAMEQMLDKGKKRPGIVYWLPVTAGAAALILLFLGWWLFRTPVVKPQKNQNQVAVDGHPGKSVKKQDTGTSGGPARQMAVSSKQKIQDTANYVVNPANPGAGQKNNTFFNSLSAGKGRRNVAGQKNISGVNPGLPGSQSLIANNGRQPAKTQASNDKKDLGTADDKKDLGTADAVKQAAPIASANVQQKDTLAANNLAANNAPAPAKVKSTFKPKSSNRAVLALTAVASSDINGTNSFQGGKVGGNFGAMFSVGVKKWTFSTGAMYSIKPYDVGMDNYHTGYVFKYAPSNIGVNCRMIDIPLNVNYQVYNKNGNKFTVGSGLSSYIILREDYRFSYDDPYASGPSSYSVINKNRNIMGIVNLDATYQRQLNSRVGVVFEPYLKIPLSNVGAGQAKLQSAGIAVGLSWNINSFNKPK